MIYIGCMGVRRSDLGRQDYKIFGRTVSKSWLLKIEDGNFRQTSYSRAIKQHWTLKVYHFWTTQDMYKVRSAARHISLLNLKADPFLALVKATVFMMTSSWLSPQQQPPASLSNHSGEKRKQTLTSTFLNGFGFESQDLAYKAKYWNFPNKSQKSGFPEFL